MKKLLFAAVVAFMGVTVNAQEFRFGPKAGYSFSTLKIDDSQDDMEDRETDPSHTFFIGGIAEYKMNDKFAIQGELLYSPLGGKEDYNVSDGSIYFREKTKVTLETLLVPVSGKYFISEKFSVSLGASFGFILAANQRTVIDSGIMPGLELEGDDKVDIKNEVKSLNFAPFAGAEFALENGLFFDARYNFGASNINNDGGSGKVTNSFAQIGVGFKFGGN